VPFQIHVADHLGIEQADGVAGNAVAVSGQELVGDGGAADIPGRFENRDLEALLRQIISAGQAVVAGTNDDRVV